jgi:hypothetical protein
MAQLGVDHRSAELAYTSKPNIAFPGTQAQADEVEVRARFQHSAQGRTLGTQSAAVTPDPNPGALDSATTFTRVNRDGLKAAT